MARYQSENPSQEPAGAFDAGILPVQFAFGRGGKQSVKARGIGSVARHHVVGGNRVAHALRHLGATFNDHALGEKPLHRLGILYQSQVAHHFRPEARVDQVQDGVLHAADVLIDRKPVCDGLAINWLIRQPRIGIAIEVPGRVHEGVHGIGFAARFAAALRTLGVDELRHFGQGRTALQSDFNFIGQQHRQIFFRHRHHAAFLAVKHRNGRSPVALARDSPVFQAISDGRLAKAMPLGVLRHFLLRLLAT